MVEHEKIVEEPTSNGTQVSAINGLVLSGGLSTRMGIDKGEIHYHNKSQRSFLYELLLPYCASVYISCNADQLKHITDMPEIVDTFVSIGPMGGILSAFKTQPKIAWLAVACDLPFMNKETIEYLFKHRNPLKKATTFWDEKGKYPEPMITIWEPDIYPILTQSMNQGIFSLRKMLANTSVEMLTTPNTLALKNANTKEEYKMALKELTKYNLK